MIWFLVRTTLGLVLLIAGGLKAHALLTGHSLESGVGPRWVQLILLECELVLGIWLLSGVYPVAARTTALVCFAGFLAVGVQRGLAAESSCGCFGRVSVSPWAVAVFDLLAVAALWVGKPRPARTVRTRFVACAGVFTSAVALAVLGVVGAAQPMPATLTDEGDIVGEGDTVVLEPERWVGKRFPLLGHIDVGHQLATGEWVVVLYRRGCRACDQVIKDLEPGFQARTGTGILTRLALIEIPGSGSPHSLSDDVAGSCLHGKLSGARNWLVRTPVVLRIGHGKQTRVIELVEVQQWNPVTARRSTGGES